jgi:hypothetical protein
MLGTVIIHRGAQVRVAWLLVCIGLFTIPFALRATTFGQWVIICSVWLVIAAALVWRYRQLHRADKADKPPPWAV